MLCQDVIEIIWDYCDPMKLFVVFCGKNDLNLCKFLYHKYPKCIPYGSLRFCFEKQHLEILSWILSLNKIRIDYPRIIENAIYMGDLIGAKYFNYLKPLNDKKIWKYFIKSCDNGHIDLAKWFYSLTKSCHGKIHDAFNASYCNNRMDVVKWLYSLGKIRYLCAVYRHAVKYRLNEMLQWVQTLPTFFESLVRCGGLYEVKMHYKKHLHYKLLLDKLSLINNAANVTKVFKWFIKSELEEVDGGILLSKHCENDNSSMVKRLSKFLKVNHTYSKYLHITIKYSSLETLEYLLSLYNYHNDILADLFLEMCKLRIVK